MILLYSAVDAQPLRIPLEQRDNKKKTYLIYWFSLFKSNQHKSKAKHNHRVEWIRSTVSKPSFANVTKLQALSIITSISGWLRPSPFMWKFNPWKIKLKTRYYYAKVEEQDKEVSKHMERVEWQRRCRMEMICNRAMICFSWYYNNAFA